MSTPMLSPSGASHAVGRRKHNRHARRRYLWAYLFMLPQLLFFLGITLYPIVMSYVYSFYNWIGAGPLNDFIGLQNYVSLFQDPQFWKDFEHTLEYSFGTTIIVVPGALILALIFNNPKFKGRTFYRTLYFLPVVTTTAIVGIIMQNIFGAEQGAANQVLSALHLIHTNIRWLLEPSLAMLVLIIVGSWKFIGIVMVYWLAGLQSVPGEAYEAAQIDGAGYWRTLWHITLPILKPILAVILLLTIVNSMHVFDLAETLTGGGPYFATETLDLYIYRYAFANLAGLPRTGYAAAGGVCLGIFVFLISIILGLFVRLANRSGNSSGA